MIEVDRLTKTYGHTKALDELTFSAESGRVTGFLGPNGAGKSTCMRIIVGLDSADSGSAIVNGKAYASAAAPACTVGALLDEGTAHPRRSARNHLAALALTHGIPLSRVDEVLDLVGLASVARKNTGTFSLGMRQRLGIAAALLGDPDVLILDEPVNGLDPAGVRWVRTMCRTWAAEGRTVLLSSHLMSEVAQAADDLVIIGQGRVLREGSTEEICRGADGAALEEIFLEITEPASTYLAR